MQLVDGSRKGDNMKDKIQQRILKLRTELEK